MPTETAQIYQASVNPSRRAKAQSSTTNMLPSPPLDPLSLAPSHLHNQHHQHHPATMSSSSAIAAAPATAQTPAHQPSKRGRKPNPLSRSARETQRKLNHSIIEKARRTKINEALAELRRLVPTDWGRDAKPNGDDEQDDDKEEDEVEEDGEDDADYMPKETRSGGVKRKASNAGKGEGGGNGGKEKEFKLEVLERTVGYLKEVVGRVEDLEGEVKVLRSRTTSPSTRTASPAKADVCGRCQGKDVVDTPRTHAKPGEKRKRPSEEALAHQERPSKRPHPVSSPALSASSSSSSEIDIMNAPAGNENRSRLPSISSWLPSSSTPKPGATKPTGSSPPIDPMLLTQPLSRSRSGSTSPRALAYLPSPPSSTQFNPINAHPTIGMPPKLNLSGPVIASPVMSQRTGSTSSSTSVVTAVSKGAMTPEDEFAASSLLGLQIGMERRRRSGSLVGNYGMSGMRSTSDGLSASSSSGQPAGSERERENEQDKRRVQTPGSLLGLIHPVQRD